MKETRRTVLRFHKSRERRHTGLAHSAGGAGPIPDGGVAVTGAGGGGGAEAMAATDVPRPVLRAPQGTAAAEVAVRTPAPGWGTAAWGEDSIQPAARTSRTNGGEGEFPLFFSG